MLTMLRPFCSFLQNIGPQQTGNVKKKVILYHKYFDEHFYKGLHMFTNPWLQKRVTKKGKKTKREYRDKLEEEYIELNRYVEVSDMINT